MKITLKQLLEEGACESDVEFFRVRFGEEVEVTEELCLSVYNKFDWHWASTTFLTAPALAEYDKVKAPALAEYDKVRATAWAEYDKVKAPALAEYDKVRATAWAEYDKLTATALDAYKKATAPALDAYKKATAPAFARVFNAQEVL